jgi:hypothetical protein
MVDRRIDPSEGPRDDRLYVARIQEDKKEKEKYRQIPSDEEKAVLLATFFSYLKKMFDTFSPSKKIAGKVVDLQSVIEHLEELKKKFAELSEQDLSNSPPFATALSKVWCKLFEDYDNIAILFRKRLAEVATFRELMDAIKHFPPESDHRLGYYLLENAGEDWLPFPFIEMLKQLHEEHIQEPNTSTLSSWQKQISTVIKELKSNR